MGISFEQIVAAQNRIADGLYLSPCPESIPLSELCGCKIFCKLDYLQRTGSFKERGARNALQLLTPAQRRAGVIAASAGNHALGLAYHGKLLGIPITVVMPKYAPLIKLATCRRLGGNVVLKGDNYSEARAHAEEFAEEKGLTYIHGFDHPDIIAGQGTIGLEIVDQVPQLDAVVVPIGGGGLIAGVATAVKTRKASVEIIGVEPEAAASFAAAVQAGRPIEFPLRHTLADGLAVAKVGENAFATARPLVNRLVTVSEEELSLAILRLVELEKSVVEGAGAAPLAACTSGALAHLAGKNVVLLLCGGNIDPMILNRVIERGLLIDGRLCRFTATVSDRPGSLAHLAQIIASTGASVKEIAHDRAFSGPDVTSAHVLCTVETIDRTHMLGLYELLRADGIGVVNSTPRID